MGISIHLSAQDLVLEEVVVTATKKEENVQDIAQTVNALTDSAITDYQIRGFSEISQLVSGVEFSPIDPRRGTITIRGQVLDPDTGGPQPIQVYVDENPVRPIVAFYDMFDMERVEVLKGTQGTLQGVVSSAGALHIYSRSAEVGSGERNGYVKTTWADNMTSIVEAASDFHLSDTLSMRIAAVTNSHDGTEVTNIRTGVNENHQYDSGRISVSWEPSDNLSVKYKYQNMEVDSIYPQPVAGSNGTPSFAQMVDAYVANVALAEQFGLAPAGSAAQLTFLDRPNYSDIPANGLKGEDRVALHFQNPRQNTSAFIHNLMVDYDAGSHAVAFRYSKAESDAMGMIDRDFAGAFTYGYPQEVRTNTGIETMEMRLSNQDNDTLEYTIGFFSRDSQTYTDADLDRTFSAYQAAPQMLKPLVGPGMTYKTPNQACEAARKDPAIFASQMAIITCMGIPVDAKVEAVFANFKYNLSERTFVQIGVRDQEVETYSAQNLYLPLSAAVGPASGGGLTIPRTPVELQRTSPESTTGSFKLGHYMNDDVLIYASSETGYRRPSSTIAPTPILPSLTIFDEEESTMFEIGMKGTFMDGRLRLNAAYFDFDIEGFQSKWDNVTARTYTANGPGPTSQVMGGIFTNNDATITGLDIEYAYVVNENLTLGGGYTANDSEYAAGSMGYANDPSYTGMAAAMRDVSGTPVNDAAESSLTFYLDHVVPASWGGERYTRYNLSWRDERTNAINPDLKIKALYLANIIVGWRSADEVWDASFFVKNITDDVDITNIQGYYSDYSILGGDGLPSKFYAGNTNMGRQIGAQIVYNF